MSSIFFLPQQIVHCQKGTAVLITQECDKNKESFGGGDTGSVSMWDSLSDSVFA